MGIEILFALGLVLPPLFAIVGSLPAFQRWLLRVHAENVARDRERQS